MSLGTERPSEQLSEPLLGQKRREVWVYQSLNRAEALVHKAQIAGKPAKARHRLERAASELHHARTILAHKGRCARAPTSSRCTCARSLDAVAGSAEQAARDLLNVL